MNLRNELRRYNQFTVPDYLFEAWRVLFEGYNPSNREEILRQAEFDLQEDEHLRKQRIFNRDRRQMTDRENAKFNWSSK